MRQLLGIAAAVLIGFSTAAAVAGQAARVQSVPGWEAVGRLNIGGKAMCTASLIAPDMVLTAAHCMYDIRSGRAVNPRSIKFEAGLNGRRAKASRQVVKAVVHPGYRHGRTGQFQTGTDIAVLRLDSPISANVIRPLVLAAAPERGMRVDVMSYSHRNATSPRLQSACQVIAARQSSLITTCRVDFGASGSPVLQKRPGRAPQLVSVISSKARMGGRGVSLAAPLGDALQALMRQAG
ncbi:MULTISPECIES: trypsin-like serine peptidase [unclassified Leisingera]|uniref:trypsin-like serine peptidase n=1 Tax=unclassified Leisingera TaxID=2614906 RepID=UPI0010135111|nr:MULTISPECIES: trypsin-like serine protease [unclassified Leisingera]MBQ4824906.1 trypsin-like serine protease [Leisingera sp. HS039]MCF6432242.1 trypsin-like serine protease [Leisingera sp. MMG026]QAX28988.1 trypsin-like serine protease [Leisingera sp. NJS204]QBR37000.1 trypsin-like serine protease [Leisingera sp. NJS201]